MSGFSAVRASDTAIPSHLSPVGRADHLAWNIHDRCHRKAHLVLNCRAWDTIRFFAYVRHHIFHFQKHFSFYFWHFLKKKKRFWLVSGITAARDCHTDVLQGFRCFRTVWMKVMPVWVRDPRRWNRATGPISATICSVLKAGWKPVTPCFWKAPEVDACLNGALFNKPQILHDFSKDIETQVWERLLVTWSAWRRVSPQNLPRTLVPSCSMGVTFCQFVHWISWCVALSTSRACLMTDRCQTSFSVRCDQRILATRKSWQQPDQAGAHVEIRVRHLTLSLCCVGEARRSWYWCSVGWCCVRVGPRRSWRMGSSFWVANMFTAKQQRWRRVNLKCCVLSSYTQCAPPGNDVIVTRRGRKLKPSSSRKSEAKRKLLTHAVINHAAAERLLRDREARTDGSFTGAIHASHQLALLAGCTDVFFWSRRKARRKLGRGLMLDESVPADAKRAFLERFPFSFETVLDVSTRRASLVCLVITRKHFGLKLRTNAFLVLHQSRHVRWRVSPLSARTVFELNTVPSTVDTSLAVTKSPSNMGRPTNDWQHWLWPQSASKVDETDFLCVSAPTSTWRRRPHVDHDQQRWAWSCAVRRFPSGYEHHHGALSSAFTRPMASSVVLFLSGVIMVVEHGRCRRVCSFVTHVTADKKGHFDATEWLKQTLTIFQGILADRCFDLYVRGSSQQTATWTHSDHLEEDGSLPWPRLGWWAHGHHLGVPARQEDNELWSTACMHPKFFSEIIGLWRHGLPESRHHNGRKLWNTLACLDPIRKRTFLQLFKNTAWEVGRQELPPRSMTKSQEFPSCAPVKGDHKSSVVDDVFASSENILQAPQQHSEFACLAKHEFFLRRRRAFRRLANRCSGQRALRVHSGAGHRRSVHSKREDNQWNCQEYPQERIRAHRGADQRRRSLQTWRRASRSTRWLRRSEFESTSGADTVSPSGRRGHSDAAALASTQWDHRDGLPLYGSLSTQACLASRTLWTCWLARNCCVGSFTLLALPWSTTLLVVLLSQRLLASLRVRGCTNWEWHVWKPWTAWSLRRQGVAREEARASSQHWRVRITFHHDTHVPQHNSNSHMLVSSRVPGTNIRVRCSWVTSSALARILASLLVLELFIVTRRHVIFLNLEGFSNLELPQTVHRKIWCVLRLLFLFRWRIALLKTGPMSFAEKYLRYSSIDFILAVLVFHKGDALDERIRHHLPESKEVVINPQRTEQEFLVDREHYLKVNGLVARDDFQGRPPPERTIHAGSKGEGRLGGFCHQDVEAWRVHRHLTVLCIEQLVCTPACSLPRRPGISASWNTVPRRWLIIRNFLTVIRAFWKRCTWRLDNRPIRCSGRMSHRRTEVRISACCGLPGRRADVQTHFFLPPHKRQSSPVLCSSWISSGKNRGNDPRITRRLRTLTECAKRTSDNRDRLFVWTGLQAGRTEAMIFESFRGFRTPTECAKRTLSSSTQATIDTNSLFEQDLKQKNQGEDPRALRSLRKAGRTCQAHVVLFHADGHRDQTILCNWNEHGKCRNGAQGRAAPFFFSYRWRELANKVTQWETSPGD